MISRSSLLRYRPTLFHYTSVEAVPLIRSLGLWSTAELVGRAGAGDQASARVLRLRNGFETLDVPGIGTVRFSDNRPMLRTDGTPRSIFLESLDLGGVTPGQWSQLLSERIFFFGRAADATRRCKGAPPANGYVKCVLPGGPVAELAFDTKTILELCDAQVRVLEVSQYNSGSTPRSAVAKNRDTWQPWDRFEGTIANVVEFAIERGLEGIDSALVGKPCVINSWD